MTQEVINIGDAPADGSGDPLRVSFDKINQNFTELYANVQYIYDGINGNSSGFVTSVAGKTGQVQLGVADIIGGVSQGYVDNRIQYVLNTQLAALVDTAPTTLDTLKELADAVGNDPNFATNVIDELSKKVELTGGTMTGPFFLHSDPEGPMGAASKQYVDRWVDTLSNVASGTTQSFTALIDSKESITNVANLIANVDSNLNSAVSTLTSGLNNKVEIPVFQTLSNTVVALSSVVDTKANLDYVLAALQSIGNAISDLNSIDASQATIVDLVNGLSLKANKADVYTKAEIDVMLLNIMNDYGSVTSGGYGGVSDPVTAIIDYGSI